MTWDSIQNGVFRTAGLAMNIAGHVQKNKQFDRYIQFQREENERTRAFNKAMAEQANRWSIDQWNRENAYNTPAAVMARLREGGVNPDLFYGNSAQNLAASSPAVTPVAAGENVDYSPMLSQPTLGDLAQNIAATRLANVQAEKLEADTEKTGQETENLKVEGTILSADALTRAAQNEQALEIGKSTIYLNHSIADLNHKEKELVSGKISETAANTKLLYEKAEEVKANIRNINANTAAVRFGMQMRSREFRQRVAEFQEQVRLNNSTIRLNYEQAATYLATRAATVLNINADTALKAAGVKTQFATRSEMRARTGMYEKLDRLVSIQGDQASFNLDSDKTFKNLERGIGIATGIIDSVSGVVQSAGSFISGTGIGMPAMPKIGGFRR